MGTKQLALVLSLAILIFVVELVRRDKLTFKYALAWLFLSCVAIFFAIWDKWLFRIAYFLGFELPSNFIFFALLGGFVFLSLVLTIFLCQQNKRNDVMAQRLALLEYEISRGGREAGPKG